MNLYGGKGDKSITGKYGEVVINATVPTKTDSLFNGWEPALPATFPLVPTLHTAVWVKESDTVTADGCTYTKDMKTLLTAQKDITTATIPDGVTEIGTHAFYGCTSLANITIPDNVTEIGSHAFYSCDKLASITIPNSVTEINDYTFSCCDNLINISIPNNVIKIGEYAFDGCISLTDMTIPDSVTEIGRFAFSDCASLASVTIGNNMTFIGYEAFENCSNLENVYIFDLEAWCNIEFDANPLSNGANLYLNGNLVKDLVIPDSVSEIRGAFDGCLSLESVIIPDEVTEIGFRAFNECSNLTSVTFKDTVGWKYGWEEIEIDVTDPAQNAVYLKETYLGNSWYKK